MCTVKHVASNCAHTNIKDNNPWNLATNKFWSDVSDRSNSGV
jgi:hypothetical protein